MEEKKGEIFVNEALIYSNWAVMCVLEQQHVCSNELSVARGTGLI